MLGQSKTLYFRITLIWLKEWSDASEEERERMLQSPSMKNIQFIPLADIREVTRCTGEEHSFVRHILL